MARTAFAPSPTTLHQGVTVEPLVRETDVADRLVGIDSDRLWRSVADRCRIGDVVVLVDTVPRNTQPTYNRQFAIDSFVERSTTWEEDNPAFGSRRWFERGNLSEDCKHHVRQRSGRPMRESADWPRQCH